MPSRAALRGRLGPYRHLLDLGHGGMAEVWLAARSDVVTDPSELRVIKELKEDLSDDEDARRMFLDEGRLAMQLEHPNIVVTHEVVSYNDKPFIVMEYLDGQSLHTVRRRRGFPLAAELFVAEQVLQGLAAAHNLTGPQQDTLHVVHRDVSPRNVFITYGGDVKVVDFGIAK
ncbi:MAG: serine/threonine-protein kinase, partial [Myxococcota bacterium]